MKAQLDMVAEFRKRFEIPGRETPGIPTLSQLRNCSKIIFEETMEFVAASGHALSIDRTGRTPDLSIQRQRNPQADLVAMTDGLVDTLYTVLFAMHEIGIQDVAEAAFAEVHRSNMTKLGADGAPIFKEMKIQKGPNYSPPNLKGILDAAG